MEITNAQSNRRFIPAKGIAIIQAAKKAHTTVWISLIRVNGGIRRSLCCGRDREICLSSTSHQLAIAGEREDLFHDLLCNEIRRVDLNSVRGGLEGEIFRSESS